MAWYQLDDPHSPELDRLAAQFQLHPLHIEDCRTEGERVKTDAGAHYTFTLLHTYVITGACQPEQHPICIFAGHDFCITIADRRIEEVANAFERADHEPSEAPPGRLLYLIFDSVVDAYFPALDPIDDRIDELEDRVLAPTPELLEEIFKVKRLLVELRRLLVSTRDASMHLQRDPASIIDAEHQLYLRDLYDHIARLLDSVESERDLLNNALDIYLSSVANRTNEVMKVLTVASTIALPALVMTGIYGMNIKGLPFTDNPHGGLIVGAMTGGFTVLLLAAARWLRWI